MPLLNKQELFTELNLPELHKHLFQNERGCTQEITAVYLANSSSAENFNHQQITYSHHCFNLPVEEPYKTAPVPQTGLPACPKAQSAAGMAQQQAWQWAVVQGTAAPLLSPVWLRGRAGSFAVHSSLRLGHPRSDSREWPWHGRATPSPLPHSHSRVSTQSLFLNKAESVPLGRRRLHSSYLPTGPQQCSNTVITQPFSFSFVPCYI